MSQGAKAQSGIEVHKRPWESAQIKTEWDFSEGTKYQREHTYTHQGAHTHTHTHTPGSAHIHTHISHRVEHTYTHQVGQQLLTSVKFIWNLLESKTRN